MVFVEGFEIITIIFINFIMIVENFSGKFIGLKQMFN